MLFILNYSKVNIIDISDMPDKNFERTVKSLSRMDVSDCELLLNAAVSYYKHIRNNLTFLTLPTIFLLTINYYLAKYNLNM